MQNTKLYFRIGLLATLSIIFLVGTMFFLGLADEFADRIHFVTTFSESVQGLSQGAAVKYKGVPIGNVDKITILPESHTIRVDMRIDTNVFSGSPDVSNALERREKIIEFFRKAKQNGLCCFLELNGITGLRYIEMNYKNPAQQRKVKLPEIVEKDVIYFPSAPNTFNNIVDAVRVSLDKIAQIDIAGITRNLNDNLIALNSILSDPVLKRAIERLDNISHNTETITRSFSENFTADELEKLLSGVDRSLTSISEAAQNLNRKIAEVEPGKLSQRAENIMQSANNALSALREDSVDVMKVVQQINTTVQNINVLVEELKRDPSALIRGKNAEPVELK